MPNLYKQDFYLWLEQTAQLLRDKNFRSLDLENLIEEITAMGRKEKRELFNRMIIIVEHLLKIIYLKREKKYNLRDWHHTIIEQRQQINGLIEDSPSLKKLLPEIYPEAYQIALKGFLKKSQLPESTIPTQPPFTWEQVLDFDYLP